MRGSDHSASLVLPAKESAFLGAAARLATLSHWFETGERLVTLTGPGGIGKTRLASTLVDTARLPALFVDLSEAGDLDAALRLVSDDLGLAYTSSPDAGRIARWLTTRGPLLLVLDGCEQLLPGLVPAVARWHERAPETRLCITSRRRLGLAPERIYDVPPLALGGDSPLASEAARLLLDRAARQQPDFDVTPEDTEYIAEICARLDGIPLALELAAARLTTLGPRQLASRLREDLTRSDTSPRASLESTLAQTIRSSWELLDAEDQRWLARCSVFRGGFTASAAEALADDRDSARAVVDNLRRLRDHSTLILRPASRPGLSPRFAHYAAIRDWATRQLEASAAAEEIRRRHSEWFVAEAERLHAASRARGGLRAQRALAAERENVSLAVDRAIEARDWGLATRGLVAMQEHVPTVWSDVGYIAKIDRILDAHTGSDDQALQARLREARGRAWLWSANLERAMEDVETGLSLPIVESEIELHARLLRARAVVHIWSGHYVSGRADLERALELLTTVDAPALVGLTRATLTQILIRLGMPEEGARNAREALRSCIRVEDDMLQAWTRLGLANCLFSVGEFIDARREFHLTAELERAHDRVIWRAYAEGGLGCIELVEGDLQAAETHLDAAIQAFRRLDLGAHVTPYLGYRAILDLERQDLDSAERALRAAEHECERLPDEEHALLFRAWLAAIDAQRGRAKQASRSFDAITIEASRTEYAHLASVSELLRAHVDLALAKQCAQESESTAAARHLRAARSRVHAAEVTGRPDTDVWLALAHTKRRLAESEEHVSTPPTDWLLVHRDGDWFQPSGGPPVSCRRRKAARRLLVHLGIQRLRHPGAPVGTQELIAALWPGERISPRSARNRLHVTVSGLRKLGLAILSSDEGYTLDPLAEVRLVDEPMPES